MAIVMGLDQHRAQITAEWLDTVTGEVSRGRIVPAATRGLRRPSGPVDVARQRNPCYCPRAARNTSRSSSRARAAQPTCSPVSVHLGRPLRDRAASSHRSRWRSEQRKL
jgi:hypothetical protein